MKTKPQCPTPELLWLPFPILNRPIPKKPDPALLGGGEGYGCGGEMVKKWVEPPDDHGRPVDSPTLLGMRFEAKYSGAGNWQKSMPGRASVVLAAAVD